MTAQQQGVKAANPHDAYSVRQQEPEVVGGELRCRACRTPFPATAGGHLAHIGHWYDVGKARLQR